MSGGLVLDALGPGELIFYGQDNVEYLRFTPNGDIYVRGKLVENDKEVVQGLRDFLKAPRPMPPGGGRIRFERILDGEDPLIPDPSVG